MEFPQFPVFNTHKYPIIERIVISVGELRRSRVTRPASGGKWVTSGASERREGEVHQKSPETPQAILLTPRPLSYITHSPFLIPRGHKPWRLGCETREPGEETPYSQKTAPPPVGEHCSLPSRDPSTLLSVRYDRGLVAGHVTELHWRLRLFQNRDTR